MLSVRIYTPSNFEGLVIVYHVVLCHRQVAICHQHVTTAGAICHQQVTTAGAICHQHMTTAGAICHRYVTTADRNIVFIVFPIFHFACSTDARKMSRCEIILITYPFN